MPAVNAPNRDTLPQAWVDIDLGALVANARAFQALTGTPLIPVVKANAYGLGVAAVVRALEVLPPWGYAVGTVEEGAELRALGIKHPILVLTPLIPSGVEGHLSFALRPTIGDIETMVRWVTRSDSPFHLEIDTGMGRSGILWNDADLVAQAAAILGDASGWEGAFCQFHSSETDAKATRLRWARLMESLTALGRRPRFLHGANSAAGVHGLGLPADLVRPGIYLYGVPVGGYSPAPVVSFHAQVVAVRRLPRGSTVSYGATWVAEKPTTIVTLAAGYADGVPMGLSNGGAVEIAGETYPIAGRVTMDMTMVDVGDAVVDLGEVATFFGGRVSLHDQATAAGTIPYILLTGLGRRVQRRYRSES